MKLGRLWDALAVAALAFVVWKVGLQPRSFTPVAQAAPAPHAVFARLDGGQLALNDLRGRVVFLDFYASWCGPCRLELPLVQRWADAHPAGVVVPIDVAEPPAVVAAFARERHLRDVAFDPRGDARGTFALAGFPTIVVIDPAGRIRAKWEGFNPAVGVAMSNALARLGSSG